MTKIKAGEWLAEARQQLAGRSEAPLREAQALLVHVLGRPQAWLLAHPEAALSEEQAQQAYQLLQRLANSEPLPYLLERQEFFGLEFVVTPAVLIPRPETELLVEEAVSWLQTHPSRRFAADAGTGSGCIAVTLAYHIQDLQVAASDVSSQALEVARVNVHNYDLEGRVGLVNTDLLDGLPGSFDLVCANLPYIPTRKLASLNVTRWEPRLALDGGPDGLDAIRKLLRQLPERLAPGGLALLEIEAGQGELSLELAQEILSGSQVSVLPDLAGLPRLLKIIV